MAIPRFLGRKAPVRPASYLSVLALEDRTVPSAAATGILDFGFESIALAPGTFRYAPAGSPWTFTGGAGVSANNSPFTAGNPAAPQGSEVAFLQQRGTVTETVNLAAGTYSIGFSAAERGNGGGAQTIEVVVDGRIVGSFNNLSGTTYTPQTTSTFTVAAGSHTISFQGTDAKGGDNTAFIDNLSITAQAAGLNDAGFELPAIAAGTFKYDPTGSPWTFTGNAGVAENAAHSRTATRSPRREVRSSSCRTPEASGRRSRSRPGRIRSASVPLSAAMAAGHRHFRCY